MLFFASTLEGTKRILCPKLAVRLVQHAEVIEVTMSTADLLEAWREAMRAAELADRLARIALDAVESTERNAVELEEIAANAERSAEAAQDAAHTARTAAKRAAALGVAARTIDAPNATSDALAAHEAAARAGEQYHRAEQDARERRGPG